MDKTLLKMGDVNNIQYIEDDCVCIAWGKSNQETGNPISELTPGNNKVLNTALKCAKN